MKWFLHFLFTSLYIFFYNLNICYVCSIHTILLLVTNDNFNETYNVHIHWVNIVFV